MTVHRNRGLVLVVVAGLFISAAVSAAADARYLHRTNRTQQPHEIKMIARKFVFIPNSITVQKGERVRLVITSEDVDHGIAIKEFDIDQIIKAKQTKVVEFTADKEGKFEFFCSVFCGDGHPDMVGELIVTGGKSGNSRPLTGSKRALVPGTRGILNPQGRDPKGRCLYYLVRESPEPRRG